MALRTTPEGAYELHRELVAERERAAALAAIEVASRLAFYKTHAVAWVSGVDYAVDGYLSLSATPMKLVVTSYR